MLTLLIKDIREHGLTLIGLLLLFALVLALLLGWNESAALQISPLTVLPNLVLYLLPMATFITGSLLVVQEYMEGTRHFLETLPIGRMRLVTYKFLAGLFFVMLLVLLMVSLTSFVARVTDGVDTRYFLILLLKSASMGLLFWCIVFCFSLCGFVRTYLYLALISIIVALNTLPGIDENLLGPFALLDIQKFALDTTVIPWSDIIETLLIALGFAAAGFALALVNDGSLAERLAKPMNRRDILAISLVSMTALLALSRLTEEPLTDVHENLTEHQVSQVDPPISVAYLDEVFQPEGELMLGWLSGSIGQIQQDLGIAGLPPVRMVQDYTRIEDDTDLSSSTAGIVANPNFLDATERQRQVQVTLVLHELLVRYTDKRALHEPMHWILDGYSYRLGRQYATEPLSQDRLMALARWSESRIPVDSDISRHWNLLSEQLGYKFTNVLAWSMLAFLEQQSGPDAPTSLVRAMFAKPFHRGSLESAGYLLNPFEKNFQSATGLDWPAFHRGWRDWLRQQSADWRDESLLRLVDDIQLQVGLDGDDEHGFQLTADLGHLPEYEGAQCRIGTLQIGPFDSTIELTNEEYETHPCDQPEVSLSAEIEPISGDRAYVVIDYLHPLIELPLRLFNQRMVIE